MLFSGLVTLLFLLKPFLKSLKASFTSLNGKTSAGFKALPRTDRDMPIQYVLSGIFILSVITFILFYKIFPLQQIHIHSYWSFIFVLVSLLYILIIGFIFSAITGYFSGLVGVTASPGSAIVVAALLIAAALIHMVVGFGHLPAAVLQSAAAITIIIGGVVTGSACIANDNIQDLKVGHIIGATPWKQQVMLLLGAVVAALIVPLIMQLMYSVYGIANVMPRAGMDPTQSLPAPPAALMAAITEGVFHGNLPWKMILVGAVIMIVMMMVNALLKRRGHQLSILSIAVGIYLPLPTTVPLFIGGFFAFMVNRRLKRNQALKHLNNEVIAHAKQRGLLLACGLVAGSTLMDVVLAIPFAIAKSPDVLEVNIPNWHLAAEGLGLLVVVSLGFWFYRVVVK